MELKKTTKGDILCLTIIDDRVDAAVAVPFKDACRDVITGHDGRVVLDMEHVKFLDSSGLGALVAVMKFLPEGRRLELAHLSPIVTKVMQLTKMDRVFVVHATVADAFAAQSTAA